MLGGGGGDGGILMVNRDELVKGEVARDDRSCVKKVGTYKSDWKW